MTRAWLLPGALALLLGGASLVRRVTAPVPGDGVRWEAAAGPGLVARTVPAGSLLQAGDRLAGIDSTPVTGKLDLLLLDRNARPGTTRLYTIDRDGVALRLAVPVIAGSAPRSYLFLALIGLAAAAAALVIGGHRGPVAGRGAATAALAAFALLVLVSPAGWMDGWDRAMIALDEAARLALPPLALAAALTLAGFPARRLAPWLVLPAGVLAGLDIAFFGTAPGLVPEDVARLGRGLDRALGLHFAILLGIAALVAAYAAARARGRDRLRLRWLAAGLGSGLGPYLALVALPRVFGFGSPLLADLSLLPMALVPLAFAAAWVGEDLRLEALARQSVPFAASALLVAGIAVATGAVLASVLTAAGLPGIIAYAGVALVLGTGLWDRLRGAVANALEQRFDRDAFESRRTLLCFGRDLATENRLDALAEAMLDRVTRAFDVAEVALYAGEPGGMKRLRATAGAAAAPDRLAADVVRAVHGAGAQPIGGDPALLPLGAAGFEWVAPLSARGRTVGLLALGAPRAALGRGARTLLADLCGYAAVAIENARLYGEVVRYAETVRGLEEFRASVIESLDLGILILDLDGRVLSSNRAFRDLVGIETVAVGADAASVLPGELLDPPRDGESERRALGDRTVALGVSVLRAASGAVQGRILVVEDVSARVSEEQDRIRREKLASVGLLSAGIAHEVNTPLAGIASYVQMLQQTTLGDDPRRPLLDKVEKQAFRAARMVRNLLNFARARDEAEACFDLNEVCGEALSLLEHETKRKAIRTELELDPALPEVWGRASEMEQVVVNLAKNAIEAMDPGGALRLVTRTHDGRAVLSVEDNGAGIAAADLGRLFDPFFSTKGRQGHGLGLAVAQGIVRGHGGEIGVSSTPGAGTRVTVAVPAAPVRLRAAAGGGGGAGA